MIKKILAAVLIITGLSSCNSQKSINLFNGKDLTGWTMDVPELDDNPGGPAPFIVHASNLRELYKMFPQSIEVQMEHENAGDFWCIVENVEVPDMEPRRGPKDKWGITEGKARRIENLTDGSENPLGEWNTMIIECKGDTIKVWVNGNLVNSGFNATATEGKIALQAEGSEVEFKRVVLTQL